MNPNFPICCGIGWMCENRPDSPSNARRRNCRPLYVEPVKFRRFRLRERAARK
jgi:hypothetical protein